MVAEVLARWRGGAIVVSHDRGLLRRMDRIVELSEPGRTVYGGDYDLYAERKAAEEAAAARDLADAGADVDRAAREGQEAAERRRGATAAGRAWARASGSAPKIVLDMMAERAEVTGGARRAAGRRRPEAAAAALSEARARVERVRELSFDLPPTGLAAGKTVLAMAMWALRGQRRFGGPPDPRAVSPDASSGPDAWRSPDRTARARRPCPAGRGRAGPDGGPCAPRVRAAFLDQQTALLRPGGDAGRGLPAAEPRGRRECRARGPGPLPVPQHRRGDSSVATLSGGERLRAALACVLMADRPPSC